MGKTSFDPPEDPLEDPPEDPPEDPLEPIADMTARFKVIKRFPFTDGHLVSLLETFGDQAGAKFAGIILHNNLEKFMNPFVVQVFDVRDPTDKAVLINGRVLFDGSLP
ncbi:hypothetical protein N7537_007419 [Penicillium hordei]|uniref:Uncharacterized protein n=1 Tax=Penicillium hordei TaxID=40994 RepID=A0AAD6GXG5_9EURO|nr:uncharacterized protein N7537_007419 [Penicillium hordei]KAJ5597335.1 hypothetical protein N7537_007419 [Penicillium hordei]